MNDDTKRDSSQQTDMSKSQSAQQPTTSQASSTASNPNPADPATLGEGDQLGSIETSNLQSDALGSQADVDSVPGDNSTMADYGSAEQADTMTQGRTDVEGSSQGNEQGDRQSGGFVGSEGQSDTSSELVEDEDEDSQAPEGK